MVRAKQADYFAWQDLRRIALDAREPSDAVRDWLEKSDAEWDRQHGAPPAEPLRPSSQANGVSASQAKDGEAQKPVTNGQYRPSTPPPERPAPVKTPSGPTIGLAERMAALRAHGMQGAAPAPSSSQHRPQEPISSSLAPSSPKRSSTPSLSSSSPRSNGHATLRSPPASPRTKKGDLVADNAAARSGSAPPVLPYSDVQEPASVWGEDELQFRREGGTPIAKRENGVLDRGPAGGVSAAPEAREPHSDMSDLPSPSKVFASSFPSLDDFEKQVGPTASSSSSLESSLPSLPSVPTSLPSSDPKPARRPPPQPPKPHHLDAATFEREQRERADAMAKLAAGYSSASSSPALPSGRNGLPPALVPGGGRPPSISASPSASPLPPPTASSRTFNIPFSTEVRPVELYQYLQTALAEKGQGPRVLLLDVRMREEYESARIKGETVCLEPISLRNGIKSSEIEDSLALAPPHEAAIFAARQHYDLVVVYDRTSTSLPIAPPTSTSSDAQRVLYNLTMAIYEREFTKSLKRQPLLLRGGWEAWEKQIGVKGIAGTAAEAAAKVAATQATSAAYDAARPRANGEDVDRTDAKKANRRAAVLPSTTEAGGAVLRNGSSMPAYPSSANQPRQPDYFSPSSSYGSSSSHAASVGVLQPRLAMPPAAASRNGPAPTYDPFAAVSPHTSRPSYPQPSLPTLPSGSPSMPRTRAEHGDLYAAGQGLSSSLSSSYGHGDYSRSSFDYARPSIDYPQLQPRATPPTISQGTRPPPPVPPTLARPPPVKPAPVRSNSSFSSLPLAHYSPQHSRFPTSMSFEEGVIGLTGLKNLGNTCYMNSTIQCLSAAIPFAKYFTGGAYRKDVNLVNPLGTKGALANAVAELIRALWGQGYKFLSPVTFREQICRVAPQFRGSEQHDAQEFLGFLLDGLHEDCNYVVHKPPPVEMTPEREHDLETLPPQVMSEREWQIYKMRNDSFIVQCFQGQFRNQLRCLTCQKTSTTYNTFMPLSVPIPGGRGISKVTLMACLETFVRDEILDKDDAWHCPRCKKNRKAVKKLSLSKLPPILVIHLKRFSFHGPFSDKIETQVQYPLTGLDLTAFLPPPLMEKRTGQPVNAAPPKGYVYDLFGVTNHYGNLSSGHYTAYVRSGRDWFNIGDSKVTPCDPAVVQSNKSAYILYYALRT
ncbi:hypothetical protein JCM8097_007815 [Rhodosporidiobolus ruineniae]